jgi:hypothetical protein
LRCNNVALKRKSTLPKALRVADILNCVSLMNKVLNKVWLLKVFSKTKGNQ